MALIKIGNEGTVVHEGLHQMIEMILASNASEGNKDTALSVLTDVYSISNINISDCHLVQEIEEVYPEEE